MKTYETYEIVISIRNQDGDSRFYLRGNYPSRQKAVRAAFNTLKAQNVIGVVLYVTKISDD